MIPENKVEDILTLSEKFKENFNFMGPFRYPPERTYYKKTKSDIRVNSFGENYTAQLLDWFEKYPEKFSAIKKALRELRLIDDLRFTRDVGLGISQFLPVLVADMQLPEGSTLAICSFPKDRLWLFPNPKSTCIRVPRPDTLIL